ncbi:hypothetical protein NKG94_36850 [Micromonospora sp. M12]
MAFPLAGALALIGAVIALARPRRIDSGQVGPLRAYAVVVLTTVLLHASMIKWQPWGNRLLLYAVVLAVPLAGLWLDALFRRRADDTTPAAAGTALAAGGRGRRSVATLAAVTVLGTSALAGYSRCRTASRAGWSAPARSSPPRTGTPGSCAAHSGPTSSAGPRRRSRTAARAGSGWRSRTTTGSTRGGCCCGSPTGLSGPGGTAVGAPGTTARRSRLGRRDRLHG